jgi:hypothetical protein
MSRVVSILSRLALTAMLVSIPPSLVLSQDRAEALREWDSLSHKRTEFEVLDAALVPSRLALAAEHSNCRYKEEIDQNPIRFIKLGSRRLAIVYCWAIIGSHKVFDLSDLQNPRLVEFPFLAEPEGFGTTASPGWITWNKEAGVFQAQTAGSDLLPTTRVRHTYRFDETLGNSPFVIVRVEVQNVPGPDEWTSIWEAKRWAFPAPPK